MQLQTSGIKINVIVSFVGKGISVFCSFLLVPLILGYLDSTRYGIWLTITSLLQWIALFDFGFGNGFRNRFVEAKARGEQALAIRFVSTAYFAMAIISLFVISLFASSYFLLDLSKILNTPNEISSEVNLVILIVCCLQGVKFTIDVISVLLTANHKIGIVNLIAAISSLSILLLCYLAKFIITPTLLVVAVILMLTPIVFNLCLSFYYFAREFASYKPKIAAIDFQLVYNILNVGGQFFVIQIIGLIAYTTANIIISNLYDPSEVTPYNLAIKYFSITTISFSIILAPFWSRFTHEFESDNYNWIKISMNRLIWIWFGFSALTVVMFFLSGYAFGLWIGDTVHIPYHLSFAVMIFSILSNWNNIFAYFLNGVSRIRLQLVAGIFAGIIIVPLGIFFAQTCQLGPVGIIYSTIVAMSIGSVLLPIQYYKIISKKATGIWNK